MLEGRTLWELIEKRAAATPDARMAVDESGREMTFGEYRDRSERAAAGLAEMGIGAGDVITWQLPTWLESMVLVGAISRLGATQNPILHIFREREVGFCVKESGAKLVVTPTTFAGFDFEAMARGIADGLDGVSGALVRPLASRGRSVDAARRADRRRRGALAVLHVGHHRRPEGCAPHRSDDQGRGGRHGRTPARSPTPTATRWPSRSRTSAASRGFHAA